MSARNNTRNSDSMSNENEDEDVQCFLDVELETLRSIYINELEILHNEGCPTSVAIQLYPSTADNVDEQYVRMSLIITLPAEYPDVIPDIQIKNPRGLSDEKLQRIMDDLVAKAEERKGGTMLFEIIECAKDHLTAGNRPSCQCAICLYGFSDQDVFTKTKCYHCFHSHCLSRYVTHQLKEVELEKPDGHSKEEENSKEVLCPVCRVPISFVFPDDCDFPPPTSAKEGSFTITEELKQLQNEMATLYAKQKDKGGIIDIEAEKKKFLLEISSVPSDVEVLPEIMQLNIVQGGTSDKTQQGVSQRKQEKDLALQENSKLPNSTAYSLSRNKESSSQYQKHNQKGKGSRYAVRSSRTQNDRDQDEEGSKNYLAEEFNEKHSASAEPILHAKNSTAMQDDKMQKNEVKEIALDPTDPDTGADVSSESNVEFVQNRHHYPERNNSRPFYQRRYHNYNRYNDFRRPKQYGDGSGRKKFSEFRGPPFGTHVSSSDRRNENSGQHSRQSGNYHQQRRSVNYNQRFQNARNSHQPSGRRTNYCEYQQQQDNPDGSPRQSDNYYQPKQDFRRKPNYCSRSEEHRQYEREQQTPLDHSERADYENCEDRASKTSPVRKDHHHSGKSVEKHDVNIKSNLSRTSKNECSQKYSESFVSVDVSDDLDQPQHNCRTYRNKYQGKPSGKTNFCTESKVFPPPLENHILKSPSGCISNKMMASADFCVTHPFRRPNSKLHAEAHKSGSSEDRRKNFVVNVHKICDDIHPESNSNSGIFSTGVSSCAANTTEGSNSFPKNAASSNSVSRPPPGFAKKVVYGLPSVKPPPGFPQS